MKRLSQRQYNAWVTALMVVYIALLLLVWPYAKSGAPTALRVLVALLPALPVIAVMGIMLWRMLSTDELEQRVHMNALGIAAAVVCAASLIGGFLAAARVVSMGGDILIWVFPVATVVYGIARWLLGRRYGATGCE